MPDYKCLLFDLDGTLLNTFEGVSRSVKYTLEAFGLPVPDEKEMRRYLGPPLRDSFRGLAGLDAQGAERATAKFRERYDVLGVREYSFFEELPPTLEKLKSAGLTLAVATSKVEYAAREMLADAGIAGYFSFIGGAARGTERVKKSDVIAYVLDELKISDKKRVLMVGDRENDVSGAKANGIDCCGLLCGFGSREELEESGARFIVEYIRDILDLLKIG